VHLVKGSPPILRVLLVILVLANAGFAAWALLVDKPADPPAARDISKLKHLTLVTDAPAAKAGAAAAGAGGTGPAASSAPASAAVQAAAAAAPCVTVGPFQELERAADAAALLKGRGFAPRQRAEGGDDLVEYWVYLDGFATDAAEQGTLRQLHSRGLRDAAIMPVTDHGRRLSLGLFSERTRAEHRARDAQAMGVAPRIEEQHHREATYWVDVPLSGPDQGVSLDGLLPAGAQDAHLTLRSCPVPTPGAASSAPRPL